MVWNNFWNEKPVEIEDVDFKENLLEIRAHTVGRAVRCPGCKTTTSRRHSFYHRRIADLPCFGMSSRLHVRCRRFFCDNNKCGRRIFCERLDNLADVYARASQRLLNWTRAIAFALGGQAGEALAKANGVRTSGTSLLRLIRATATEQRATPRVLGVDDWSLRKGRTYGTLLVDLERRIVVDVLQGRDADTLAAWLDEHPGVDVISRDRSGDYALGARQGAPDAVQIADRWHLLRNAGDMVERFLTRHASTIRRAHEAILKKLAEDAVMKAAPELSLSSHKPERRHNKRRERYEQAVALFEQGKSKSEIARRLRLSRGTVIAYVAAGSFPERQRRTPTLGILAPYVAYLQRRWLEGCHNISQLWRDIKAQGYSGKRAMVKRYVQQLRRLSQAECMRLQQDLFRKPSPRQLRYWLLKEEHELEAKQQVFVKAFLDLCPEARTLQCYSVRFCHMLKTRQAEAFADWLEEARTCGVLEVGNFAAHILKDQDAVHNAMKYPWSNGQLEGQVNRLKTIKRSMYGRANFDLLRARVLHHSAAS